MTQMIWQATHHPHTGETTPPGTELAPLAGEPIALRPNPDLDRLLNAIQTHEIEEMDAVAAYRDLAYNATDPVIRSLLHMLVEDEEHHHRVLGAIAMELRAIESTGAREFNVPPRGGQTAAIEPLRKLARIEREGMMELQALARETPGLMGGLFSLLLGLIALDGQKHELILRYVIKELEQALEPQQT